MSTKAQRPAWILRVGKAHRRLFISAAIGIVTILVLGFAGLGVVASMLLGWDAGVLVYLAWVTVIMAQCSTVQAMKTNASIQDEGALAILILSVGAAVASLGAIFAELAVLKQDDPHYGLYIALAIVTVILSWTFTQTIFALHYTHEFYGEGMRASGLKFPDDDRPDYWDFIYFSFVIGMTFQVSDVAVTHKSFRRMVVAHGALSFFFSTAIVAMTVNIAAGLFQK
jgi:uncharacterized membrane protein